MSNGHEYTDKRRCPAFDHFDQNVDAEISLHDSLQFGPHSEAMHFLQIGDLRANDCNGWLVKVVGALGDAAIHAKISQNPRISILYAIDGIAREQNAPLPDVIVRIHVIVHFPIESQKQ